MTEVHHAYLSRRDSRGPRGMLWGWVRPGHWGSWWRKCRPSCQHKKHLFGLLTSPAPSPDLQSPLHQKKLALQWNVFHFAVQSRVKRKRTLILEAKCNINDYNSFWRESTILCGKFLPRVLQMNRFNCAKRTGNTFGKRALRWMCWIHSFVFDSEKISHVDISGTI